jgi:hypothetical protein
MCSQKNGKAFAAWADGGASGGELSCKRTACLPCAVRAPNGKTTALACNEAAIAEQTYYRWRKEYGGLQVDQARRLKDLL